ncbi:hypothetical protein MHBO_000362 [Bonamia ostreae]|uniref:Nuclear speckle splicing regulatory protein 1 N-terminal domain-containing protein n=1 Tax=Bonamia ostreae TaxID=126728 RepID=A0ABV2AFF5_9EUKA
MAYERSQIRERGKDDFLFKDKPVLVTPAYRNVLEQRRKLARQIEKEERKNLTEKNNAVESELRFKQALFAEKLGESKLNKSENKDFEREASAKAKPVSEELVSKDQERKGSKESQWKEKYGLPEIKTFDRKKENFGARRNCEKDLNAARERYLKRKAELADF